MPAIHAKTEEHVSTKPMDLSAPVLSTLSEINVKVIEILSEIIILCIELVPFCSVMTLAFP